jgi:predicted ATPase with chaperone activity
LLKKDLNDYLFLGELCLEGSLRPIKEALSTAWLHSKKVSGIWCCRRQCPQSTRGEGHLGLWVEDPTAGGRSVALI